MPTQPKPDRRGSEPPGEDARAFRDAMRDVKPLAETPAATATTARPHARSRPRATAAPRSRHRQSTAEREDLDAAMPLLESASMGPADPLSFRRMGVRNQVARRLRRGLIPMEGELDLHGLGQAAARELLADFLAQHRAAGSRCVRIVHGKGYRSGARGPVLKMAVDSWLRRHTDVMAFTSARTMDGGTGAVYVLLRA